MMNMDIDTLVKLLDTTLEQQNIIKEIITGFKKKAEEERLINNYRLELQSEQKGANIISITNLRRKKHRAIV